MIYTNIFLLTFLWIGTVTSLQQGDNSLHFNEVKSNSTAGVHWALLVAGSNGWYNYRHQADACHSYQIVKKHGIPDERIVVMMYDDIAYNEENPTPGIIINHPNGSDVYHGVPKDYTHETVTPQNFLNILSGDVDAMRGIGSGKVINSGPNDHIFVYFADHGAPGLVAFPDGELHARQLMQTVQDMNSNNKYKQMVFYIEACESGSMFANGLLPTDINVYATTASNSHESSYACYLDKKRNTYLGDVYSVKWMEDSDQENLNVETLHKQYKIVKRETNTSHVQQYGDLDIAKETLSNFQGKSKTKPIRVPYAPLDAVRSEDVPLALAMHKVAEAKDDESLEKAKMVLDAVKQSRKRVEDTMGFIVESAYTGKAEDIFSVRTDLADFDCYEAAVSHFDKYCFDLSKNDYALRHLYAIVNLCENQIPTRKILQSIYKACAKYN